MERTPSDPPAAAAAAAAGRPVGEYRRAGSADVVPMTYADVVLPQEEVAFCRRFGGLALVLVVPVVLFVLFVAVGFVGNVVRTIRGQPQMVSPPATPTNPVPPSLPPDTQPDR